MARNHITRIKPATAVAKGTNETEQKAFGELNKEDPRDAAKKIAENIQDKSKRETFNAQFTEKMTKCDDGPGCNPNTKLDGEEKRVAAGGKSDEEAAKDKENKNPDDPKMGLSHPRSSQAAGGKPVEEKKNQ